MLCRLRYGIDIFKMRQYGAAMKKVLVLAELGNHYGHELLSGILERSGGNHWWQTWRLSSSETNMDAIGTVLAQVDGVILRHATPEIISEVEGQDIPCLVVRGTQGWLKIKGDRVQEAKHVNDASVGEVAVHELQRLAVKHWGFVGVKDVSWSRMRGEALINYPAKVHALEVTMDECYGWSGVLRLANWLKKVPRPIGIFACSDRVGLMVMQACHYAGIKVPKEVAVIGVDNDVQLCRSGIPTLSSIDLNANDVGQHAAWQMAGMLDLERGDEPAIRAPRLVARESSHDVDRRFLAYQKALEWLHVHALQGPTVDEIAAAVGLSRRGLERVFCQFANESPAEVMRGYRMIEIGKLLKQENVILERIAMQAGFTDAAGLSNFVKRQTGKTPNELR